MPSQFLQDIANIHTPVALRPKKPHKLRKAMHLNCKTDLHPAFGIANKKDFLHN